MFQLVHRKVSICLQIEDFLIISSTTSTVILKMQDLAYIYLQEKQNQNHPSCKLNPPTPENLKGFGIYRTAIRTSQL